MLGDDGRTVEHDHFEERARVEDFAYTYTGGPELTATVSVEWFHPLGEVLSALSGAGLRIEFLHEHPFTLFQRYPVLERGEDGYFRFPPGHPGVPLMYSLRATAQ